MQCLRPSVAQSRPLNNVMARSATKVSNPNFIGSTTHACRRNYRASRFLKEIQGPSQTASYTSTVFCKLHPRISLSRRRCFADTPSFDAGQGRAMYATEASPANEPAVHSIFDSNTASWQYIVADHDTHIAVIIDPVLDYDAATATITTKTADSLLELVKEKDYKVVEILETHAHADHLTAASYLQKRLAEVQGNLDTPIICIGKRIAQIQKYFSTRYDIPDDEYEGVFDKLFDDDETFHIGNLTATAIHLPGHTPDHMGYKIGSNVFVGDSIFQADLGSARADFPGGCAESLFKSGRKLLSLPENTKIWVGHDYPSQGAEKRDAPLPFMLVKQHREQNKHLKDGTTMEEFVTQRQKRDATLAEPKLIHQSLQMNIRAGRLPKPAGSGHRMLHLPLKLNTDAW